jgi:dTDP-4-dehydrorhamnose reductase
MSFSTLHGYMRHSETILFRTNLRLCADRDRLTIVYDHRISDLRTGHCGCSCEIARKIASDGWQKHIAGVIHLAGPDEVTWCDFAWKIMTNVNERERERERKGGRSVAVDTISTEAYPTAAARPANSRLCCDRQASMFRVRLPPLEQSREECPDRCVRSCPRGPAHCAWHGRKKNPIQASCADRLDLLCGYRSVHAVWGTHNVLYS